MSAALDLVKSLSASGVEFSTDGERVRWRNGDDKVTPEVIATIAAEKATVIDFLTGEPRPVELPRRAPDNAVRDLRRNLKLDPVALPDDADRYADALHLHGPMSYGMAMRLLGWGATRAGRAEAALRKEGRITFNKAGRAVLAGDANREARS